MAENAIKLNREKKIEHNKFTLKIGTTDRLNPLVVYVEGRTFITPLVEKREYETDVKEIKQGFQQIIRKALKGSSLFNPQKFIIDFKVSESGVQVNKRSYLSFQFFLEQLDKNHVKKIKDIQTESGEDINNIVSELTDVIHAHDFEIYKNKKDK